MPPVGCWAGHARGINAGWSGAFQTTPKPGGSLLGSVDWGSRGNKSPGGRRSLGSGAPRAPEPLLEATGAVERGRGEEFLPLLPPHGAPGGAFMESRGAAGARGGSHLGSASLLGEFLARGTTPQEAFPESSLFGAASCPAAGRTARLHQGVLGSRRPLGAGYSLSHPIPTPRHPTGQVIPYLTPYPHLAPLWGRVFPISPPYPHLAPQSALGGRWRIQLSRAGFIRG